MNVDQLIGEATEYDKKTFARSQETQKLVQKCKCIC